VIYPPVEVSKFPLSNEDGGYFLIVSALAPYKRIDLAVEAFNRLGKHLVIVGRGPEEKKLKAIARPNVEFTGWVRDEKLVEYYRQCTALIFPGVEDFGIVPLEAMATGKPVIAYAQGGVLESVREDGDQPTGIFFYEQTAQSLLLAVERFNEIRFEPKKIREHALQFDRQVYKSKMKNFIEGKVLRHFERGEGSQNETTSFPVSQ